MAGFGRKWSRALAAAVLLIGAGGLEYAQSGAGIEGAEAGSLSGRLTDLHSKPLEGVDVAVRNQSTGAESRTVTGKNGVYRFIGLEPGEYSLEAESPQWGRAHLEGILVEAGYEARVQTAVSFELLAPEILASLQEALNSRIQEQLWRNRHELGPVALPPGDEAMLPEPLQAMALQARSPQELPHPLPAGAEIEASQRGHTGANALLPSAGRSAMQSMLLGTGSALAAVLGIEAPRTPLPSASSGKTPIPAPVSTTLTAAELQALPVSGRHWQDFVLDNAPASVTAAAGQGPISLQGAGQRPAQIAVDGAESGLSFGYTGSTGEGSSGRGALGQDGSGPAGMAQVGMGGHGMAVSEAAIREVQSAAGYAEAEADRAAGGRMNVETQSGANQLHGQGFLFDRQNNWGAHNPFTQWTKETTPAIASFVPVFTPESYTPPDREITWGLGAGGRIRRDKLFWFAALDNYNRNDPGVAMVRHPYLLQSVSGCTLGPCTETTGFFAQPTNDQMQVLSARLGLSSVNPVDEGLAAYSSMLETLAGLLGPSARTARQWTGFGRLDWQAAERYRFTLEGIGAQWNSPGGGLTRLSETYGNHSFGSSKASEEWLLGRWEAFLTPNLLAVTQASAGHSLQQALPQSPSSFEKSFLAGNAWGQLPQIVVDNRFGFTIGNPFRFGSGSDPDERLYQAKESLDWIRGKLLVKAGFEMSHNGDATGLLRNQTGTYTYSSVENFASDALVFATFGPDNALNPSNQHNCDQTGKVWRDSGGNLRGVGNLPCYSYYSQTMGPSSWHLSTIDWAGYATVQWQASKRVVLSGGLRWEREQLPPPLAALANPELPLTGKLPSLGNNWGPRISMAVGNEKKHWPVFQLGYGMYFMRTENLRVETALTQTGSLKGDLSFFMRPTDDLPNSGGGAPPFPYVLAGEPYSIVKPGAVEFAPNFHNSEVQQAVAAVEEKLPAGVEATAGAIMSLGRRLPVSIDANLAPLTSMQTITYAVIDGSGKGPIKSQQITLPFYASWPSATSPTGLSGRLNPDYQQITEMMSRANSTYEAAMLKLSRYGRRGLSLHAHYTYAHAMDWNPDESAYAVGNGVLDPADFGLEYGTSDLDVRHSASLMAIYQAPWKLAGKAGRFGNGWMLSGVGRFHSGMPYTMRTSGSLSREFANNGATIAGLGPGMNGSGGDNRVYGVGSDSQIYNIGRNTYRYPAVWKADLRLGRRFNLGSMRQLELLAETFNLFNHQNVTEVETNGYTIETGSTSELPTLNFLTGLKTGSSAFGQPLNINATNFYRERQIQFGVRMRF